MDNRYIIVIKKYLAQSVMLHQFHKMWQTFILPDISVKELLIIVATYAFLI